MIEVPETPVCLCSWGLPMNSTRKSPRSPDTEPTSPGGTENPWSQGKMAAQAARPEGMLPKTVSFTDIVEDEKQQRATLQRATNKPLHLIQVGDLPLCSCLQLHETLARLKEFGPGLFKK